jgi:hypothetical protein
MPITGGPYLQAALLCERVLQERDGVISLIRIVDRWTVNGPTPEMPPETVVQATMVLMFKSGFHRGPGTLAIAATTPGNETLPPLQASVNFEGDDDRGINVVIPMMFQVQETGVYWFSVELDGHVVSHIPLRVLYQRIPLQPPPSSSSR